MGYHTFMRSTSTLVALCALLLTGCPAAPLDNPPLPDAAEQDMYIVPDMIPAEMGPEDMRIKDALPLDQAIDAMPLPDFGDLPDLPDPAVPPALEDTAVLVGRLDTWVGWIIAQRLYAVRIDTRMQDDGDGDAGVDGGVDAGVPTMGRPEPIAGLPPTIDRLVGVRSPNGRPWVLVPDGAEGRLRAHDLSQELPPRPLQLWPPVRTAIDGDDILLVGYAGPAPETRVATVRLEDDGPRAPVLDTQGIALPVAVSPGLSGWVFAFADGVCQTFLTDADPAIDPVPGQFWRCATRPDITLVGDSRRIYAVGPIGADVRAWTTLPGVARRPTDAPVDGDPRQVTLATEATVTDLHIIPGGRALLIEDAEATTLHLVTADRTRILPTPPGRVIFGAARFFQQHFVVSWDAALGQPVIDAAPTADGPPPPTAGIACNPLPEQCDPGMNALDEDCVGPGDNARCCRSSAGNIENTALNISSDAPEFEDEPVLPWFVAQAPGGLTMIVSFGDRLDLLRPTIGASSDNEDEQVQVARFDGIERIERFGQHLGSFVIHGHRTPGTTPGGDPDAGPDAGLDMGLDMGLDTGPDAGPPPPTDTLLWYLGRERDEDGNVVRLRIHETEPPCLPVMHLTMRAGFARIYCADEALDVPFDDDGPRLGELVAVPYPVADVRWIGPPLAEQVDEVFLAATGDEHRLHLWRDTADGAAIVNAPLPAAVAAMPPEDRQHPIRPPESDDILPARILGATLEVYIDGVGWSPSPSTRWPESATFSKTHPLALTLTQTTNPELPGYMRDNRRYVVALHALHRDELHWGQPVVVGQRGDLELVGRFMHGVRFADYDPGDPLVWYGFGDSSNIVVQPRGVECQPATLLDWPPE